MFLFHFCAFKQGIRLKRPKPPQCLGQNRSIIWIEEIQMNHPSHVYQKVLLLDFSHRSLHFSLALLPSPESRNKNHKRLPLVRTEGSPWRLSRGSDAWESPRKLRLRVLEPQLQRSLLHSYPAWCKGKPAPVLQFQGKMWDSPAMISLRAGFPIQNLRRGLRKVRMFPSHVMKTVLSKRGTFK